LRNGQGNGSEDSNRAVCYRDSPSSPSIIPSLFPGRRSRRLGLSILKDGHSEDSLKESPEPPTALVLRIAGLGGSFPSTFGHTCIRNSETIQHRHKAQGLRNSAQLHGSRIYIVIYCEYRDETWDEMSEGEKVTCQFPIREASSIHIITQENNPIDE
jgi:hypothetical protein